MAQMFQIVTGQLAGLIDFEQKSLICTTTPPLPSPPLSPFLGLDFELHTPTLTNC